jgi:hypothetical protein
MEWGSGKVLEISANSAMIQFSDGKSRKIAVSYFTFLQPAAPSSYSFLPEAAAEAKAKTPRAPRAPKKKK